MGGGEEPVAEKKADRLLEPAHSYAADDRGGKTTGEGEARRGQWNFGDAGKAFYIKIDGVKRKKK